MSGGRGWLRAAGSLMGAELRAVWRRESLGNDAKGGASPRRWAGVLAPEELPFDASPARAARSAWGLFERETLPDDAPPTPLARAGFLRRLLGPEPLPLDPPQEGRS